jgi:thiosulfate dehydrogenase
VDLEVGRFQEKTRSSSTKEDNMRKLSRIAICVACLGLMLALAGCDGDNGTSPTPPPVVTPPPTQPPPSAGPVGDAVRGGALYDKWWAINGGAAPTTTHPGYPGVGQKSGADTWRCKECHGWDYQGVNGAYGSGSHFTGIEGVLQARDMPAQTLFNQIKMGGNHDFSQQLSDQDVADLVEFVQMGTLDMDSVIDFGTKQAMGDVANGGTLWSGNGQCANCHGADGRGNDADVPGLARDNPWETLHKIRWGHPGSSMGPTSPGLPLSDQADILTYSQSLP